MRKRLLLMVLISVVSICCLTGCKEKKEDNGKLNIVTTLFPQYDFVRQIAGDKVNVSLLLDPGVEAHMYDPTPKDRIEISSADLFIYTGDNMEPWAANIIKGIEKKVMVIDASYGILLDSMEEVEEGHDEEEHDEHEEHNHEEHLYEPHFWTNPIYAIKMAENVTEALCKLDEENDAYYRENFERLKKDLESIDSDFHEVIDNARLKKIIIADRNAFYYWGKEYGVEIEAAYDSCSADSEPSAKRIAHLIEIIEEENIECIYYTEMNVTKLAEKLKNENGVTISRLHSIHNLSKEEMDRGETYVSLMLNNVASIKAGLE